MTASTQTIPETTIHAETRGSTLLIRMEGPETRNAITGPNFGRMRALLADAGRNPALRAVVITGDNGYFSSGGNLRRLKKTAEGPYSEASSNTDLLSAMILGIRDCPLPVIAAVEGGAVGVATSLALACDMIVAASDVSFTVAYVRIGLTPDGGVTHFLSAALPRQIVSELCLTGAPITAERLATAGLVNRVVDKGTALDTALDLATRFDKAPRTAVSVIKSELNAAPRNSLAEQLALEAQNLNHARYQPEGREGIAAFLEKRKPEFPSNE
ncbi:enoyl-CoA hydratase/isomerase family protein [Mameliella alba]|nr:enoyl-CoA hydratase/isomerase family protein [Mameliella alba]MBY6170489.1 enoyl-CoA hydratase/isomerase family protein [Mameliella alba]MBY6175507.1 enoyl-CoA hydratase/isomerase family protein [Mameliella alba]